MAWYIIGRERKCGWWYIGFFGNTLCSLCVCYGFALWSILGGIFSRVVSNGSFRCRVSDGIWILTASYTVSQQEVKNESKVVLKELLKGYWLVFLCSSADSVMYSSPAVLPLISSPPTLDITLWLLLHNKCCLVKCLTKQWWSFSGSDIIGAVVNHVCQFGGL